MTSAVGQRGRRSEEDGVSSPGAAGLVVLCALVLVAVGLMMLFSIGIGEARPLRFPVRQGIYSLVALGVAVIASRVPMVWWRLLLPWVVVSTVMLLLLARLAGPEINGAHRWLKLGPVNFQPSELGKFTAILWIAHWLGVYRRRADEFWRGFALPAAGLGGVCVLVLIGPDYGTTALIGGAGVLLMFIGGTRTVYLFLAVSVAGVALGFLVWNDPVRLNRVTSFLNPEKYSDDESYQLMNALYGIMEGGVVGKGIGQSLQKRDYLPEAHTDFILAIIAEELGMLGTLAIMGVYLLFFFAGMVLSWRSRDPFSRLMGFGITLLITLQAGINIGVVTGSMPTKGLPLPFISYGGSNLVVMAAMVGILVRIARGEPRDSRADRVLRDSRRWV